VDFELRALERGLHLVDDARRRHAHERARLRAGFGGPALGDFIQAAANAAALELVSEVAARRHAGHVFLDGPTGTGKTHLLRALAAARPDSWLMSGVELDEWAVRAIARNEVLDLPRLTIVDDLLHFPPLVAALVARSLGGGTLVAAGAAAQCACAALSGRLLHVGPLEESGRAELFSRAVRGARETAALPGRATVPDELPPSGFEILGLARSIELGART
jgi:hypothetical protein